MKIRRWLIRIGLSIVLLLIVGIVGFVAWGSNPYPPSAEALAALQSDAAVIVTNSANQISFVPANPARPPVVGLIYYPGGRVAPEAYAVYMRRVAERGYPAFIVKMPLNFAVFGVDRAQDVIKANPQITAWAIAGHSLGGSMAAQAVANNPKAFQGIIFLASYPAVDLSRLDVQGVALFGTEDGVLSQSAAENAAKFLPANTRALSIAGANHAYFGNYGAQDGDKAATIPQTDAQDQIVTEIVALLRQLDIP
jgi:predicted esterase